MKVVMDALSGRQVIAGNEEVDATQPFVDYLTQRLGWNPLQIRSRPQWRVPRTPSGSRKSGYPVDLAIFDSAERRDDPEHVRILVECKAPSEPAGIDQLKTYLGLEPEARLGIWFNGQSHVLVYKTANGYSASRYAPVPRPGDPLALAAAQKPLCYGDLIPPPNLGELFLRLRDRIAAQDSHVNRDEFILNDLSNLLVCKIADEQAGEPDPQRPMAFQAAGRAAATAHAIRNLFLEVRSRLPSVFTDDADRIHIDDDSLQDVVMTLQPYRLLGHDRHAVGKAFQVLRGRALKGEEGAYFTPPAIVDCAVSILDPEPASRIIDPACGTGGFLAAALDHVFESIDARRISAAAKSDAKHRWSGDSLFAIDKDAVSTRLCKAYLTLLGDGRSHVYRANAIDRGDWPQRTDDLTRVARDGSFDLVMTNPPFGMKLTVSAEVGRRERLMTCRTWRREGGTWQAADAIQEQQLGIVFFERSLNALKQGGRMAIVLPETFLFSSSFAWFVDWICSAVTVTHVVDVPMVAFEEFCRAKTCLVFIAKRQPAPGHHIVFSYPRSIGQDKRGNPLLKLDEHGERTGELDNETADGVRLIVGGMYRGFAHEIPRSEESRLCFHTAQEKVRQRGILVPRFWWRRDTEAALHRFARKYPSTVVTLGELAAEGAIAVFEGHGSPPGNARATGDVPYVKVTDLKNWRINENPTNFINSALAAKLRRRGPALQYGDLISPARASSNIGQFSLVLPWQTNVVLTREVLVIRVCENRRGITAFLLLALMSLKVVQGQYQYLTLMQTNREHLGDCWREVQVPLPQSAAESARAEKPAREYFEAIVKARESYAHLTAVYAPEDFGTRP
jgi:type I restriction enzyme M protein